MAPDGHSTDHVQLRAVMSAMGCLLSRAPCSLDIASLRDLRSVPPFPAQLCADERGSFTLSRASLFFALALLRRHERRLHPDSLTSPWLARVPANKATPISRGGHRRRRGAPGPDPARLWSAPGPIAQSFGPGLSKASQSGPHAGGSQQLGGKSLGSWGGHFSRHKPGLLFRPFDAARARFPPSLFTFTTVALHPRRRDGRPMNRGVL